MMLDGQSESEFVFVGMLKLPVELRASENLRAVFILDALDRHETFAKKKP